MIFPSKEDIEESEIKGLLKPECTNKAEFIGQRRIYTMIYVFSLT